jgi:hypothetical protein
MSRHLAAVPDQPVVDPYGTVDFLADSSKPPLKLTVGVSYYGMDPGTDIVLDPNGFVSKHPYDVARNSTEEERAAVGWTW